MNQHARKGRGSGGPIVTFSIITRQSRGMLKDLLDSLFANPPRLPCEVLVVDNASVDGTAEMVETEYPDVRLIRNGENVGVAPARNQTFREARGKYVIILDVDTLIREGAVDAMVEQMDLHPGAAIGGPKLVYGDGSLQLSCRPFPGLLNIVVEGTFLRNWFPNSRFVKEYTMQDWDHKTLRDVDWMYGACLIFRRESFRKTGLFDEKYFYLYEDVDLCFRAKKAGCGVIYIPQATVVHFLRREDKGVFHPGIGAHLKSITRYILKNRYEIIK
jgi:GT2 family glycosyltransferase